jgi:membrane associated rhomboid family serine protease
MIIPIGDDNTDRRTTPWLNYFFILCNILVFVFLQNFGNDVEFTYAFSTVPAEIVSGEDKVTEDRVVVDPLSGNRFRIPGLRRTPVPVYLTILTSMFMHGGMAHIIGNMLFLFVFGDNIEDRLGRMRYLLFYLLCGVLASLAHVFSTALTQRNMYVPSLGASGAVSGVLGGYILLFPRKRVRVIFFRFLTQMPALYAIGIWFGFQLLNGIGLFGEGSQLGGVAYAAHIGGFVAGVALVKLFSTSE